VLDCEVLDQGIRIHNRLRFSLLVCLHSFLVLDLLTMAFPRLRILRVFLLTALVLLGFVRLRDLCLHSLDEGSGWRYLPVKSRG
jgi:hypothetical protein